MKQAVAGVAPPEMGEVSIMTVWPSISQWGLGRWIGRVCGIPAGYKGFMLGRLLAPLMIPLGLVLYFARILPPPVGYFNRRYRLTNRRLIEVADHLTCGKITLRGFPLFGPKVTYHHARRFVELDRFDSVEVIVRPGQEWFPAGDLVFRQGNVETFRIQGIQRPETFRHVCLKAHHAYVLVTKATAGQRKAS